MVGSILDFLRIVVAIGVALVACVVGLPAGTAAPASLRLHVPLPARAHQTFALYTVRVRGRAPNLPIRPLTRVPASMRAAVAVSPATFKGHVTTFTVAVAIEDLRGAARTLTAARAVRTLDLEAGDKTFPALSDRGVTGTCPQSGFAALVKQARTGFRLGAGKAPWRRVALDAVTRAARSCSTDPLLQSQTFTGFSAVDVTVAKLNGDGIPDLVVLERPHALRGYAGTNNGTFKPSFTLQLDAVAPTSVTALTGSSGRSDFYVTDSSGPVLFVDNQGATFRTSRLGFSAIDAEAGSFDAIGTMNDAAFVDGRTSSFFVVLDDGASPIAVAADTTLSHVTAGDFNDDGRYDLAGAGPAGVSIATGDGSGSFSPRGLAVQQADLTTSLEAGPLGANPDLVVGTTSGVLVVDFSSDLSYFGVPLHAGTAPAGVALADVTGDARLDLLALNQDAGALNVWVATPAAYRSPVSIAALGKPSAMAVGRFNADTRADVAVATDKGFVVLLGRRAG